MKKYSYPNGSSKKLVITYKFNFFLLLFTYIIFYNVCNAQTSKKVEELTLTDLPQEKVYLHTDKTYYNSGDDIWFKAYLVDAATLKPEALSKVAYVELINSSGEIISSKTISIDNGCGNGDFHLEISLPGGEYTLRAYTTYMRNFYKALFFRKKIYIKPARQNQEASPDSIQKESVVNKSENIAVLVKPDVQFFPEGGDMVCGFPCRVGIKAVGSDGKGIDITGIIVDDSGHKITEFNTLNFGLGAVYILPLQGKRYKARIKYNGNDYTYNLPEVLPNGAVLQVTEQKDFYSVIVRSSLPDKLENFSFAGIQNNILVSNTVIENNTKETKLIVPKNIFKEGIAQFTLFNGNDTPVCERLIFAEPDKTLPDVNITTSKKKYSQKEKVELDITLEKSFLRKTETNMSVSVAQVDAFPDESLSDIKSSLLLQSELRGEIEHPGYYFYSADPQRKNMMDLLMLTQGWRRFVPTNTIVNDSTKQIFLPETGLRFEGKITKFGNHNKTEKAIVSLTINSKDEFSQYETDSDEKGHFKFDNIAFTDSASVIIQAKKNKKNKETPGMNYYIELDSLIPPQEPPTYLASKNSTDETIGYNYPKPSHTTAEIDSMYHAEKGDILIKEVLVTAPKQERMAEKRTLYKEPSYSVNIAESFSQFGFMNALQILNGRIPGLLVAGSKAFLRGPSSFDPITGDRNDSVQFFLDGIPVEEETALSVPVSQIHFVDVLMPGPRTTIYGSAGANGIIAIYTLDAEDMLSSVKPRERKGIINFTHPGFGKAREFYLPVYISEESKQKPDYRSTLYWNPTIVADKHGKTKLIFYTSDILSGYKVILEGLSSEGDILHTETRFDVN